MPQDRKFLLGLVVETVDVNKGLCTKEARACNNPQFKVKVEEGEHGLRFFRGGGSQGECQDRIESRVMRGVIR